MAENQIKVLVNEDEEPIRMLLTDLLESQGFKVITACNGVEGVRRTFAEAPDLVLTDIIMPDMDGIAYVKRVRSQIPVASLPIIVVSALGMEEHIVKAFDAGATDYLVKPFRQSELLARVQVALQQRLDPKNLVYVERDEPSGNIPSRPREGMILDLGKYRIISEIGAGGMGTVYHARHLGYGIDVAIKLLKPDLSEQRHNILRFLREVRIAAQLDHPNIVRVFDVGLSGEYYYYAMESLPDHSLYHQVKAEGALPIEKVVAYGLQLSRALDYMHRRGLLHRDVKPDNVLLVDPDTVKLIDFGLACSFDDSRLTQEGTFVGTPGYVAPESIREYRPPTPQADIYALGATLYLAAAGQSPFHKKGGATQKLSAQVLEPAPMLHKVNPKVPTELSAIIMTMLSRRLEKRPKRMAAVVKALEKLNARLMAENHA